MKYTTSIALIAITFLLTLTGITPAMAQGIQHGIMHEAQSMTAMPAVDAPGSAPLVSGEIRKIDLDAGKITIRHAEIPNLEMPPMTMVFRAATPDLLNKAKVGDQVLFTAEKSNGALTITSLQENIKK